MINLKKIFHLLVLLKRLLNFLAMIDQQKAFLKRNEMPTRIVEQLEVHVYSFKLQ